MNPRNWSVRWRLAATSAGLTLAILLVFGAVVGQVATSRVRGDFNRDLEQAATRLVSKTRIVERPFSEPAVYSPDLGAVSLPTGAMARVISPGGVVLDEAPEQHLELGPPKAGVTTVGALTVATQPVYGPGDQVVGYIQYARSDSHVDSTIDRLWLFVAAGALGGALLASLAGVTIAGRAMRPIAALTATARKIADTGDPSQHMPKPKADDEVGELAATLEQMLRSLDAARAEREAAMKRQREFVADASHELRTPLTSILANLELLQESLDDSAQEEERAMIDSALRSSGRMSRLVGDLLLLARADAGRIGARTTCDLAEIAGNAAVEVAPTMGDRELHIDNDRPLPLDGNPDELHRLVLNLLDNAVRHTPPGSTIDLRLRKEGADAVVEVADDGPGVPPPLRTQVFDRFVRGDGPADTAVGGGSGLGLAIVRAVALSHGGSAEVADSDRGGALFRIRLPLAPSGRDSDRVLGRL